MASKRKAARSEGPGDNYFGPYERWNFGYGKRFGLVHVDFETLERRPKDSFYFYSELAQGGPLERE